MCRWKVLVILFVLYKYNSSQPVPEAILDRPSRQLNFEECCPCVDNTDPYSNSGDEIMDAQDTGAESMFSRPRDVDDCPCRFRNSDSQGASSLLFPSTMYSPGNSLRSGDNRENLKPIFNPEVGLAASVLETIKEVTNEEYEAALARDAAKTDEKEADDFLADAAPEESGNIISAIVEPEFGVSDKISEESHVQKSRCIDPTEYIRYNSDNRRLSPKSSSLFNKPKLFKPKSRYLRKHEFDMDNSAGASNVYEQIIPTDLDPESLDISSTKAKTNTNTRMFYNDVTSNSGEYCEVNKIPDFRSVNVQNKLKSLTSSSLKQSVNGHINLLNKVPKFKLGDWLRENDKINKAKQNIAIPSTHEVIEKKSPFLKMDEMKLNVKENNSPLSLKNLLNLRDVELVPFRELFHKQVKSLESKKEKLLRPSFSNYDSLPMTPRNEVTQDNNIFDFKEKLRVVNDQESSNNIPVTDDCEEEMSGWKPVTNKLYPESNDISPGLENRPFDFRNDMQGLDNNCIVYDNKDQTDCMIDSSYYVSKTIEKPESEIHHESGNQYNEFQSKSPISETQQVIPDSINKAMTTMTDKLTENLEEIKNFDTNDRDSNIIEHEIYNTVLEKKQVPVFKNKNQVEEYENNDMVYITKADPETFINKFDEITTTTLPYLYISDVEDCVTHTSHTKSNVLGDDSNNDAFPEQSWEKFQKQSDDLLQQERNTHNSKSKECLTQNDDDAIFKTSESNDRDVTVPNLDNADILIETVTKTENSDSFNEINNAQNTFLGSLDNTNIAQLIPVSTGSNEFIMATIPEENNVIDSQTIQVPREYFLKDALSDIGDVLNLPPLKPLSTLDNLNMKLAKLLPNNERETTDLSLDNIQGEYLEDSEKSSSFQEKSTEQDNCSSDSMISELYQTNPITEGENEFTKDSIQDYNILSSQAPLKPQLSFLKESMSNLSHSLNISPIKSLPGLDNIKEKIINLFDSNGLNLDRFNNEQTKNMEPERFDNIQRKNNEENSNNLKTQLSIPNLSETSSETSHRIINAVPRHTDTVGLSSVLQPQLSSLDDCLSDTLNTPLKPNVLENIDNIIITDNELDLNNMDSTGTKKKLGNEILNNCKEYDENTKDLVISPIDSNVEASDIIMNIIPNREKDIHSRSLSSISDSRNPFSILKSTVNPVNIKNTSEFILPKILELKQVADTAKFLNSDMSTDASSSDFKLKVPSSKMTNNDESEIRPLKKTSVLQNIPQLNQYSFKNKLPLQKDFKLKSTNIPSPLRDDGLLRYTPTNERNNQLSSRVSNLRSNHNIPKISKLDRYENRQSIVSLDKAPDKRFSTLRNPKKLESRPPSILDTIARRREEFNDKLKILESLHKGFNDKIDSVRNDILDNPKLLDFRPVIKKSKDQAKILPASNRRLSAKPLFPQETVKIKPVKKITLPRTELKRSRMPTTSSVKIPKGIHVPEFDQTSKKLRPIIENWKTSQPRKKPQDSISFGKQTNKFFKPYTQNKFISKDEIIKNMVISTTPRSSMLPHLKDYNEQMYKLATNDDILKMTPNLSSSPKAAAKSFFSKAKDDVQSRLPVKSPVASKQSSFQTDLLRNRKDNFGTDMFRAGSETKISIDESLKENISYKCHMVCGKD